MGTFERGRSMAKLIQRVLMPLLLLLGKDNANMALNAFTGYSDAYAVVSPTACASACS